MSLASCVGLLSAIIRWFVSRSIGQKIMGRDGRIRSSPAYFLIADSAKTVAMHIDKQPFCRVSNKIRQPKEQRSLQPFLIVVKAHSHGKFNTVR